MGKSNIVPIEPRHTFSHARIKPVVVEKITRRGGASTVSKRERPTTEKDPVIALRVPAETIAAIDKWGGDRVSRSEAIHEIGLASKRKRT
jgi:hypothetical protein